MRNELSRRKKPHRGIKREGTKVSLHFFRLLVGRFYHVVKNPFEFVQAGSGNNNVIATAVDVFGDAQKPSARIFLEREQKCFSLNLHFVAFECIFLNLWPRLAVGPPRPVG